MMIEAAFRLDEQVQCAYHSQLVCFNKDDDNDGDNDGDNDDDDDKQMRKETNIKQTY